MKILTYTNSFKLIFDILFKPQSIIEKINLEKQETIDRLVRECEEKLNFIEYEQYKNGIVPGEINRNQIALTKIPRRGIDFVNADGSGVGDIIHTTIEYKDLNPIRVSYTGDNIKLEEIKNELASRLGRELVDKGFIQTKVSPGYVEFYINTFI